LVEPSSFEDAGRSKKPAGVLRRRAIVTSAVESGLSAQAIAVRRHDRRMMVVMTMMEVELHLKNNPKQDGLVCQIRLCEFYLRIPLAGRWFFDETRRRIAECASDPR